VKGGDYNISIWKNKAHINKTPAASYEHKLNQ
jgi:hypothetical protein